MSIYRKIEQPEYEDIVSRILYEDNHYLIINKRAGEIVQGDKTGDECLAEKLKAFVAQRDGKPGAVFMGVAHRLDRPVSGAVIFAKTSKGLGRINTLLREGGVHKIYWAVVCGEPPAGKNTVNSSKSGSSANPSAGPYSGPTAGPTGSLSTGSSAELSTDPSPDLSPDLWTELTAWLYRNEKQNKTYIYGGKIRKDSDGNDIAPKGYKFARLRYRLVKATDRYHIVAVMLLTGRHHQIRAQLASIGCPIKGDLKYGAPRSNRDGSISLHARELEFVHPVGDGKIIRVTAPLPDEFSVIAGQR